MRKAPWVTTWLVAVSTFALGQQGVNPPDRAVVEGTVINSLNGRVIPRADVTLRDIRRPAFIKSLRADGAGHFIFNDLNPGAYRLSADHQSFFLDLRHKAFQPRLEVVAGEHRKNIMVRLLPTAVVTGQVVDEYSEPIEHVQVKLFERAYRHGRVVLDPVGLGLTDDQGNYRIYDVHPGSYYVLAEITPEFEAKGLQVIFSHGIVGLLQVEGTGEAPPEREIAFSPLFYPGTRDFLEAHALTVGPGDEVSAGFIFMTMPSVTIRGRVTNGITGEPAENPSVTASWTEYVDGGVRDVKVTPKDGSFEVRGLTPGSYTLRASFSNNGSTYTTQRTVAVGPSGLDNVLLVAVPDSDVAGSVHVEDPSPTAAPLQRLSVEFQSKDTFARSTASAGPPSLQFQTMLHPGDHYIVAARGLPGDYYLKGVRVSGHDVERDDVMVSDRRSAVELVLSPDGGHIEGLVVDEQDQPVQAAVVLIPEDRKRNFPDLFRKTGVNSKGAFTLRGVPPGSYKLLAFDDIDLDDLISHPEILTEYADRGETVVVSEKGTYRVPLEIIRAN